MTAQIMNARMVRSVLMMLNLTDASATRIMTGDFANVRFSCNNILGIFV